MTPERIAELRALAEAARPGPWKRLPLIDEEGDMEDADERFIMAARTALPEALDAIERVRELCQSAEVAHAPFIRWEAPDDLSNDSSESEVKVLRVADILAALEGKSEPPKPTLQERYERFVAAAKPGVVFVNEYGRRSEILSVDSTRRWDGKIEHGPYYDVMVDWSDAKPSEDSMPWWTIGEPEGKSDG